MFKRKPKVERPKRTFLQEVLSLATLLGVVFLLRTLVFQPFTIPSGSMEPGLMKGDYIIVSKFATGYGRHSAWPLTLPLDDRVMERGPDRGDVVVFRPEGVNKDYIKRVIGIPGDTVAVRDHVAYVNGQPVPSVGEDPRYQTETLDGRDYLVKHMSAPSANLSAPDGEYSIPPGYYFVLGDNRDNSLDSRVPPSSSGAGLVPSANIVGEAKFVLLSVRDDFSLFRPWTWYRLRGDRFFKGIE